MPASTSALRQSEATSRWGASEYVGETIPTGMGRSAARAQRPAAPVLRPRLQRADFDNIGSFIFSADMIISTCTLTWGGMGARTLSGLEHKIAGCARS